ncbi:hypothetical protein VTN31DRAFT_2990 [Thermomyces dupontii]|uniref:uncharacterized protein n=1 Tax=Talaromyces thermophilus TaxID=28565 RepID=UPI003743BCEA
MDLRSIMNSDTGAPASSPTRQSTTDSVRSPNEASTPNSTHNSNNYFARPPQPQPAPIQPPHHSPSSLYGSVQYTSPVSTAPAGAPLQHARSPPPPLHPVARDPYPGTPASPAMYSPQQVPRLSSPYTSQYTRPVSYQIQQQQQQQGSYFSLPGHQSAPLGHGQASRSSYSSHSSESPHSATVPQQLPPPQSFSPTGRRSQPGTPLGPPPATFPRPPSQSARPPSAGHDSHHTPVPSMSWGSPDGPGPASGKAASPPLQPTPSPRLEVEQGSHDSMSGQHPGDARRERERSVSVSPKTVVPRQSFSSDIGGTPGQTTANEERRKSSQSSPPGSASSHRRNGSLPTPSPPSQSHPTQQSHSQSAAGHMEGSPSSSTTAHDRTQPATTTKADPGEAADAQPKHKKVRYDEPPIYARKAPRRSGMPPVIPNPRPPFPKHSTERFFSPGQQRPAAAPPAPSARPVPNGATPTGSRKSVIPAPEPTYGPLGPWEPSITGLIPHEELTKVICDFLFQQVVLRRDLGTGPPGATATGPMAVLEVEAKLGQLIDRDRGGRLRLPVMSECILNREEMGSRTAFESSMSLNQHRAMNNFLNEAVKASLPPASSNRIPLSYAHKKERDTFYEVSTNELPPVVQHNLHPRHKPRVRVTTDQQTGEVIAQIVKCRIADLDVYSPRTNVDWRVSVNLEMNYDGDVRHLTPSDGGGARGRPGSDRNKDRMSYRHLAYQIDLTQVAIPEASGRTDFEHELEVEVSAAEVRRQGDLAMAGDPKNQYEDLIKGFIDNIRVLARAVPAQ